jgi:calcineurin-like phosphoesterase family protein
VLGNHDRPHRIGLIRAAGFTIIEPPELGYQNWLVRFTHRPLLAAELGRHQLNVHGHTHSKVASTDLRWVNVSVEATDYRPVRLRDLLDERIDELTRTHCP